MTASRPTPAMIEQAAYWAAQLATEDATEADREDCERWCRLHPAHRVAMDRMRGLDAGFARTDAIERRTIDHMLDRRSRKARRIGGAAVAVALLAGSMWLLGERAFVGGPSPDYRTRTGEQRSVTLADGSMVTLDTDAAVAVDQEGDRRRVTLLRGRILARVAKDKSRPFVVETPDGTATALGTAFIVRRDERATTVTVVASQVRVCVRDDAASCATLSPGERMRLGRGRGQRLASVDPGRAAIWAEGWLAADDRPVAEVLDELNRYRERPVRFDPARLAGRRVSGSFPLNDPDRALDGIARLTGLRVSRDAGASPTIVPDK